MGKQVQRRTKAWQKQGNHFLQHRKAYQWVTFQWVTFPLFTGKQG